MKYSNFSWATIIIMFVVSAGLYSCSPVFTDDYRAIYFDWGGYFRIIQRN